ncbi:ATP-binding cassette domain-containing protein [Scytonema sp. UIC 10036]|uniref:ABC transporter ATP-binding protein n=1 Tax=Scytonema sp. UIC 10036 TaxID=2304196 RepID=UPI0012DA77A9|nr:ABC transporter ATP-binding protein [Scytonema sp. UIC 10036]MUG96378.1 ATP-binding cassette domain-containing protein [Scytonema sp. UIC 10036]
MDHHSNEKELKVVLPGIRRILSKLWPYIHKRKKLVAASFFALLIETGFRLLEPWPLKYVFDHVLVPTHNNSIGIAINASLQPLVLLSLLALSIVVISGLASIAGYLSTYGMSLAVVEILSEVRADLFSHLQYLSLSFHQQFKSGDLITRLTTDIEKLRFVIVKTILPLVTNIVTLTAILTVMLWLNGELALVALAIFPLFFILTSRIVKRIRKFASKYRSSEGVLASTTGEMIGAIKVVQVLSLQNLLKSIFSKQNKKSLGEVTESLRLSAALERTAQVLMAIITAIVLWRGSQAVLQKSLSPGDLLVFMTYLKNAFDPMRKLSNQMGQIAKATASGERVVELLEYEPSVRDLPSAKKAHPFFGAVRFENVSFAYTPERTILKNVSFVVQPGQQVAVVGPSGSGKSTLLSLILRLYDPVEGRILIDGQDIREYTLDSLRQQVSTVMQESVLFAVSVRENIAYGKSEATNQEVEKAARQANAHDFIMNLPQGYDTILAERGATLSGGQRQRVAIARAAIRQAPIVILDEPTTGLDNASDSAVSNALERLTQGRTTFIISHNLRAVKNADLILYIENGSLLESGTHSELIALGARYASLYRLENISNNGSCRKGDTYALEA